MINPDYKFVREVFGKFDQLKFYDPLNTSFQTEVFKKGLLSSRLGIDIIFERIASYHIQNTQDWLYMTGQLNTHRELTCHTVIDRSAERLLKRLNIDKNLNTNATQRLWEAVFQEVYQDVVGKEIILNGAYFVDPHNMRTTRFQVYAFRVCQFSTKIFSSPKTGLAISVICFCFLKTFEYAPLIFICRKINLLIPKWLKVYHKNIPLSIRTFIHPIYWFGQKIYINLYPTFIALCLTRISLNILSLFPGRHLPLTNRGIHLTQYVVEPCMDLLTIPTKIFLRLSVYSFFIQQRISNSAYTISNQKLNSKIDLAGHKAFNIWMGIFHQSKEGGICRIS